MKKLILIVACALASQLVLASGKTSVATGPTWKVVIVKKGSDSHPSPIRIIRLGNPDRKWVRIYRLRETNVPALVKANELERQMDQSQQLMSSPDALLAAALEKEQAVANRILSTGIAQ